MKCIYTGLRNWAKNVVAGNFTGKKKDGTQKNTGFCIHYYNFIWDYLFM